MSMRMWLTGIALLVVACADAQRSTLLLKDLVLNASALSITSLHFRRKHDRPRWVNHLMGNRAVFCVHASPHSRNVTNTEKQGNSMVLKALEDVQLSSLSNLCSIELLGFARVGYRAPFTLAYKHVSPSVGQGELRWMNSQWRCFFRATYDNWRKSEARGGEPNFWPVFIYCFSPYGKAGQAADCAALDEQASSGGTFTAQVKLDTILQPWSAVLQVVPNPHDGVDSDMAVCSALPYVSSVESQRQGVAALFFEFMRYYASMGFRVMVYDGTAVHAGLLETKYCRAQLAQRPEQLAALRRRMEYHNFSVLSLLHPDLRSLNYDNREGINKKIYKLDDDRALSLTHCRFDAEARLGIRRVLAVDFDEFMFCPHGDATAEAQGTEIRALIGAHQQLDQLMINQRVLMNRSALIPGECVARQVNRSESLFECFSANEHLLRRDNVKSLHLSNACPFTSFHHACQPPNSKRFRQHDYDCNCDTAVNEKCVILHLSLRVSDVGRASPTDGLIRERPVELLAISNTIRKGAGA